MFKLIKKVNFGKARLGLSTTRKGQIKTPCFMPVATKGGLRAISVEDLYKLDPSIVLGNTYHLMLRPGEEALKKMGGMHELMNWSKPILTDSGGFQVFSLSRIRKLNEAGVVFRSHLDGKEYDLSPENSIKIQMAIGSDIMMVLDECVELPAKREYLEKSIEVTTRWAERCLKYYESKSKKLAKKDKALLFGIVQGGLEKDLRLKSANDLSKFDFDGYAVGGLSVGESAEEMYSVLDYVTDAMPEMKPRYLMGVGYPHQIVAAVKRGVDMFDCVIPAREARHGRLYRFRKVKSVLVGKNFYETLNLEGEKNKFSKLPINPDSAFPELRNHTLSYLRHLFMSGDPTAQRLTTLNNLEFYLTLMKRLREELKNK